MVEDTECPCMSVSFVARQNGIAPNLLLRWRKLVKEEGLSALKPDESVVGTSEAKQLKNRIRELERILSRKTMEMEILQEALEVAHAWLTDSGSFWSATRNMKGRTEHS